MAADGQPLWKTLTGCLIAPFAILLIPFIPLLNWFGWNKMNAKPKYVIEYLERFIEGAEGEWDWDDFCSIPLTDPALDDIRERACNLWRPEGLTEADVEQLRRILNEARALEAK